MKKIFVSISLLLFSLGSTAQESADFKQVRNITEYYLRSLNYYVGGSGTSESIVKLFATSYSNDRTPIMDFNGKSLINESFEGMLVHCRQTIKHVDWDRNKIVPFYSNNSTLKTKVEVTYTYLENAQDKSSIKTMTVERVFEFAKREGELKIVSIVNASFIPQETIEKHLSVSKQKVDFGACKSGATQEAKVIIEFDKFSKGDLFTVDFRKSEDYRVFVGKNEIKYNSVFDIIEHQEEITIYFTPKTTNNLTRSIIIKRGNKTEIISLNGTLDLTQIVDQNSFGQHLSLSKNFIDFGECKKGSVYISNVDIDFGDFNTKDKFTIKVNDHEDLKIFVKNKRVVGSETFKVTNKIETLSIHYSPKYETNFTRYIEIVRGDKIKRLTIHGRLILPKRRSNNHLSVNKTTIDFGECSDLKWSSTVIYFEKFKPGDIFSVDFFDSPYFSVYVRGKKITKRTSFNITSASEQISVFFNPSATKRYSDVIKVHRGLKTKAIMLQGKSNLRKRKTNQNEQKPDEDAPNKSEDVPAKAEPRLKVAFNLTHLYDLQENKFGFTRSLSNAQGPADIDLQGMNGSYTKFDIAYGGHLEIPAGKKGGITLGYMSGTMTSQFENQYAETTLQSGTIGFRRYMTNYNPSKGFKVRPYLELGGGLTSYSSNRHFVLDEGLFSQTEGVSFFSSASLGLEFSLTPMLTIATSSNFVVHLSDAIDGYDNLGNDLILNNTLGLVIRL